MEVLVIGAGFGGLGAALALAEAGARVRVCEALTYPGGCASTFTRHGVRYEAGATLSSGLAPHQLFGRWIDRYGLSLGVDWIDPVAETRAPGLVVPVARDHEAFVRTMAALDLGEGRRPDAIPRFFADQRRLADALWALFDDPSLLPPLTLDSLLRHLGRAPALAPLLPWVGRPFTAFLARYGLGAGPLRTWLGGVCQITVQCEPDVAETAFTLAAMDYYWRGTGHVRGGIGRLAEALVRCIREAGGEVRFAERVRSLRREGSGWVAETRHGPVRADRVVANLLPGDLAVLLGGNPALERRHQPVADGWGAVMLYRVVRAPPGSAHHLDLTLDPVRPLTHGNHVFVSVGATDDERGEPVGTRALTASTHVDLASLRAGDPATIVAGIQAEMRRTIAGLAPELDDVVTEMPASPRTFQRFVRRREGAVGGVPRRAGLSAWSQLGPVEAERGLWLAGDSVFPGQSTFAAALGGVRVAAALK
jgi:phytoene dehydrogenase-like protein